jgi:hypothetical protein
MFGGVMTFGAERRALFVGSNKGRSIEQPE